MADQELAQPDVEEVTPGKVLPEPRWLRLLGSVSSALNRIAAGFAAILLVLMVALILVEIVLRFFSRSTFMADALVGHGVAAITFLAVAWALEQGSMIRIGVVTRRLPDFGRFIAEWFTIVGAEVLTLALIHYQWLIVAKLWIRGSVSHYYFPIPLWIPEAFFLTGLLLLALQLAVKLCRLLVVGLGKEETLTL